MLTGIFSLGSNCLSFLYGTKFLIFTDLFFSVKDRRPAVLILAAVAKELCHWHRNSALGHISTNILISFKATSLVERTPPAETRDLRIQETSIHVASKLLESHVNKPFKGGGRIAQWIAYLLLAQRPRVRFSAFPRFFQRKFLML